MNFSWRRCVGFMMDNTNTTDTNSGRHYWFLVTYLVLTGALGSFVNDMFTPALPAMCKFFHTSIPTAQMGLTTGMIGLAVGQMVLGPLSDHIGRKPVMFGSLGLFVVAAVVSVFSPSIHFFIWCRLFQGLGASGCYFLSKAMPADLYSGRALAKLMALIGAINGIAPASAPVAGGVTADAFGWRGIFVVLAIFGFLTFSLTFFVKESLPPSRRDKKNLLYAFADYTSLLKNKKFMTHVAFKGFALGFLFAYISATPFIMQTHFGMSQTRYGLVIGFNALFVAAGSISATRFNPLKRASVIGAICVGAGSAALAAVLWLDAGIWLFEACMWAVLFGLGLIFTTTNTLAMNEGRAQAGEAAAIIGIAGYVVGAVVSPLVGMGNIMHSTAITFLVLAVLVGICAAASAKIAPDLNK